MNAFPLSKFPYSILRNNGNIRDVGDGLIIAYTGAYGATASCAIQVAVGKPLTFTDVPPLAHFSVDARSNAVLVDTGSNVVSGRMHFCANLFAAGESNSPEHTATISVEFVPAPILTWDIPDVSTQTLRISAAHGVEVASTIVMATSGASNGVLDIDLSPFLSYCPQDYVTADAGSYRLLVAGPGGGASISNNAFLKIDEEAAADPYVVTATDRFGNAATIDLSVRVVAYPFPPVPLKTPLNIAGRVPSPAWSLRRRRTLTPAFGRDVVTYISFRKRPPPISFDLMKLVQYSGETLTFTMEGGDGSTTLSSNTAVLTFSAALTSAVVVHATSEKGDVATLTVLPAVDNTPLL